MSKGMSVSSPFGPRSKIIWASILIGLVLSGVVWLIGFDPLDADVKYDWLVANQALKSDGNAYENILLQAKAADIDIVVNAGPDVQELTGHPRTPGAILLQLPLVLFPAHWLFPLAVFVSVTAVGFLAASMAVESLPRWGLIAVSIALFTIPLYINLRYAGQAAVVGALAIWGWRLAQRDSESLGGLLIGMAAVLKIFPVVLVVALVLAKQWRASLMALATGFFFNLGGLTLPGVSMGRAFDELSSATSTWAMLGFNGSLVHPLIRSGMTITSAQVSAVVLTGGLILATLMWSRKGPSDMLTSSPFILISAGLLMVPLSWASYDIVLLPGVIAMVSSSSRPLHLAGLFSLGLWVVPVPLIATGVLPSGEMITFVRIVILVSALVGAQHFSDWRLPTRRSSALRPNGELTGSDPR